jgi:hypothetical protein
LEEKITAEITARKVPINNEKEKNLLAAIPNEPLLSQRAVL